MARLQYQPATKPRGFQPIQLSRAGIARMEEEGNRVIRNLEKERDATNQQRQDNLQAMQANAAAEQRSQAKNQDILQTNLKTELAEIQNKQKFEKQQAASRDKLIDSSVETLVNFSTTLGEQAAERTKQMITDQVAEGAEASRQEYLASPKRQSDYATVESQIDVSIEQYDQSKFIAGQAGLDSSLETARSLVANPGRGYYWKKGYYNEFIKQQTPMLVDRALQSTEELFVDGNGNKFSGIEAVTDPNKMRIVLGRVQNSLYGATGLDINSLEPGFLEDSSKFVVNYSSTKIQQAANKATNIVYDNLAEEGRSHINQGRIGMGYRLLLKIPSIGREGALKEVFALYSAQNADGTFRYSVDELDNIKLLGDKTIFEERGNSQRYQDAIAARRKAQTDFLRDDQARVRIEAKEFSRQAYDGMKDIFNTGDYQEDINAIETFNKDFLDRFDGQPVPENMISLQKSVLAKNKQDEQLAFDKQKELKSLTPEFIDGILNPEIRGKAAIAYKEQKKERLGPDYARTEKTIKAKAIFVTQFNKNVVGTENYQTFIFEKAAKKKYEEFYKAAIASGVAPEVAQVESLGKVDTLVNNGISDPKSDFYRTTGPLNSFIFPKLEAEYSDLSALAKESQQELLKGILKKGIKIVDVPGALGTVEELEESNNDFYSNNGKFRYNSKEQLAAKVLDIPLYAVRNARTEAFNKADGGNRRLIEPTILEKEVFDQDPRTLKLITDIDKITRNRFDRAIPGQVYPRRRTFDTSRKEKAYIDTIRTVEGTAGPQGYNTVYGGAVVPQLTQMTLGELYDAIKLGGTDAIPARLGGGKIPFKKDKYNSSASGALQLMPETLRGLINSGNFSETDIFSPDTQDRMLLQLSREGGIDINNPDFNKAGNIWAGASPALGQTNRKASDTMSIYNKLLDQN